MVPPLDSARMTWSIRFISLNQTSGTTPRIGCIFMTQLKSSAGKNVGPTNG